eukprot:7605500-Prorocentrum_lima.AAC.1
MEAATGSSGGARGSWAPTSRAQKHWHEGEKLREELGLPPPPQEQLDTLETLNPVSYTHLRAHETRRHL